MSLRRTALVLVNLVSLLSCVALASAAELRGAWAAELYVLKDGTELPVEGRIFFTDRDWTVLFFVTQGGEVRRGSGEGGTYTLEGDALTFRHFYNLSAGEAVASLPEAPLRMTVREPEAAAEEPCRVEIGERDLTLFFPSGNEMRFSRR